MANVVRLERCAGMVSDLIPRLRRKLMQALPECGKFMGADSRKLGPTRLINLVKANRRIFPPTPLGTRGWTKGYARRSAVERLNTRLDDGLSFESHTIRGKPKRQAQNDGPGRTGAGDDDGARPQQRQSQHPPPNALARQGT